MTSGLARGRGRERGAESESERERGMFRRSVSRKPDLAKKYLPSISFFFSFPKTAFLLFEFSHPPRLDHSMS